jgi:hypothetical protein
MVVHTAGRGQPHCLTDFSYRRRIPVLSGIALNEKEDFFSLGRNILFVPHRRVFRV